MDLFLPVKNEPNRKTGKTNRYFTKQSITHGIVLPRTLVRTFIYDSSYNAANRRFSYGALFDKETTVILIDTSDATIQISMHVVIDNTRFEIEDFDTVEGAYVIMLKRVANYE